MYETIVVPFDGSELGEQAVGLAADVARRAEASVLLVHVIGAIPAAEAGEAPESLVEADRKRREKREEELARASERLAGIGVSVETRLETGRISDTLVSVAEEVADLVVMATHGRGPLSRFWLGSVADALARRCTVPLLLHRPREDAGDRSPNRALRRMVLPLDGSTLAESVLAPATTLGDLYGAGYTLVRVVRPIFPGVLGYEDVPQTVDPSVVEEREEAAAEYLEEVAQRLREEGREVATQVARGSSVPWTILEIAASDETSTVALASHGRGGLERVLLGSTADKVVRGARGPVLLHRPSPGD